MPDAAGHELTRDEPPAVETDLYAMRTDERVDIRPIQGPARGEWIDVPAQMLFRLEDLR